MISIINHLSKEWSSFLHIITCTSQSVLLDLPQSYEAPPALGFATSELIFVFAKEDSSLNKFNAKVGVTFYDEVFCKSRPELYSDLSVGWRSCRLQCYEFKIVKNVKISSIKSSNLVRLSMASSKATFRTPMSSALAKLSLSLSEVLWLSSSTTMRPGLSCFSAEHSKTFRENLRSTSCQGSESLLTLLSSWPPLPKARACLLLLNKGHYSQQHSYHLYLRASQEITTRRRRVTSAPTTMRIRLV